MLALSVAASKIFEGTISIRGCRGPSAFCSLAIICLEAASSAYASTSLACASLLTILPGWIRFTIPSPIVTAVTVVIIYSKTVLPPILDNFAISFKSETPLIRDARMSGIAISLRALIKIVPNGFIQSTTKSLP